jgi:hypothetical protein
MEEVMNSASPDTAPPGLFESVQDLGSGKVNKFQVTSQVLNRLRSRVGV